MIDFDSLKIKVLKDEKAYGKFEIGPVSRGYGQTLANPLRRVLLSSLEGAALTSVKINGVKHEFSTLSGLSEDILQIVLNLKSVVVVSYSDKPQTITITKKGQGVVTAGDFETPSEVEIISKDVEIANLADSKSKLELEATVEKGVGYKVADDLDRGKIGLIPLDANFSPVERVSFTVEDTRVGRKTDFDKVVMEVYTNGAKKPTECMTEAAKILVRMYAAFAGESDSVEKILSEAISEANSAAAGENVADEVAGVESEINLQEMGLSTRAMNSLVNAKIKNAGDLIKMTRQEISSVEGLGKKSVEEIEKALAKLGLGFKE